MTKKKQTEHQNYKLNITYAIVYINFIRLFFNHFLTVLAENINIKRY